LIILSVSFWTLIEGSKRSYLGFLHYKVARNIKSNEGNIYKNLNEWMLMNLFSQTAGIDEQFLPIVDVNSYGRLVNGYAACDGLADTYIRLGEFLNIKGYTITLFNKEFSSSPHTTAFFSESNHKGKLQGKDIFDSKSIQIIDSLEHISFKKNNKPATFSDICNKNLDDRHLKYSTLQEINFSAFCNIKETWEENLPIDLQQNFAKKIYYKTLDFIPEKLLLLIHESIVEDIFNEEEIFFKARHYDVFGNDVLATRYYNEVITRHDISLASPYKGSKNVSLKEISKYFLTRLENRQKKTIQPNPFSAGMFYEMYEHYVKTVKNFKELYAN